jgi:hypothetical protein
MAGTVVLNENNSASDTRVIHWDLTTDGSGNADKITDLKYSGILAGVMIKSRTPAPTTGYGISLLDKNGFDLMRGRTVAVDSAIKTVLTPADLGGGVPLNETTIELRVERGGDSRVADVYAFVI